MTKFIKCFSCCFHRRAKSAKSRPSIIDPKSILIPPVFINGYELKDQIGKGKYGKVYKVLKNKKCYAIKRMVKTPKNLVYIKREIETMEYLSRFPHQNIVSFFENIECKVYNNLVLNYCEGCELFDEIIERDYFKEKDAKSIILQLLFVVKHLHELGIMHRDLKPENIIFNQDKPIKIIDFGLSRFFDINNDSPHRLSQVGTSYYMSPEVIQRKYTSSCDEWSVGIILYILLCGYPPFNGKNNKEILCQITEGTIRFTGNKWLNVSNKAKDIIKSLLNKDYLKRVRAVQCLKDDWFKDNITINVI